MEVGKYADLVIWEPAFFGVKPKMVVKCGMIAQAVVGDANATIPTPEPMMLRNQYAAFGKALGSTSITFVSTYAYEHGIKEELGLNKIVLPVRGHRTLTKKRYET